MTEVKVPQFNFSLKLKLVLESDGKTSELVAGNIEDVFLQLHSYGFEAKILFSGCDDEELADLIDSKKPTNITLTFFSTDPEVTDPLLELKGLVVKKWSQRVDDADNHFDQPLAYYKILVYDNACETWGKHFPTSIYVDKSMKEAIEEHKNPQITLKYDFPPLEEKKPITAFSLPLNKSLPKEDQPSFYSFVNWYLHQEGGIFAYDYKTHAYSILAKKEDKGESYKIRERWITPPIGLHPSIPRFNPRIVTHTAQNSDAEDEENEDGYKLVRSDIMDPEGYTVFPGHAHQDVVSLLDPSQTELTIHTRYFDEDFHVDKLIPGSLVGFPTDLQSWTQDHQDQVYRSRCMIFSAKKTDPPDIEKPVRSYLVSCTAVLEPKEETYVERPPFHPPVFPFEIEGKLFCDVGDEKQSTYKINKGKEAPQGQYLVLVPLAGKDLKVVVPFLPNMPGHFFFPYDKDHEVLLEMHFRTALILRAINHQNRVLFPDGHQGKQIVLSYNGTDEYSLFKHEFKEGKKSVVTIEQATSDKQTQVITIQDKEILIQVTTKEGKTVFIKYSSEKGIFITVDDKASKMVQEIALDGKQISQTCKNDSDTNTIVQTPDTTTFTCKNFNVKADKIVMDAKEDFNCKGGSKVNLEAPVTNAKTKMKVG